MTWLDQSNFNTEVSEIFHLAVLVVMETHHKLQASILSSLAGPELYLLLQGEDLTSLIHTGHRSGLGSVSSNEQEEKHWDSSMTVEEWRSAC